MADDREKAKSTRSGLVSWEDVFLTPLNETDIDSVYVWQNSPRLRDLIMGFRFPVQIDAVREWIKNIKDENAKSHAVFGIRLKNELVGTISLHSIDPYQRKSLIGIYIGNSAQRNKGIGFISTCLVLDYAFNGLDLRKINLEVIAENPSAIALYERIGFTREGIKRKEYYIDGKYIDTHQYGILKYEFKQEIPKKANRLLHTL